VDGFIRESIVQVEVARFFIGCRLDNGSVGDTYIRATIKLNVVLKQRQIIGVMRTLPGALLEAFFNDPFQGTFSLSTVSQGCHL
jgi:hypothetical protein